LVLDYYLTNVLTIPIGPVDIYNFESIAQKAIDPAGGVRLGQYRILQIGGAFKSINNPAFNSYPYFEQVAIWQWNVLRNDIHSMKGFEDIGGYTAVVFSDQRTVFKSNRSTKMLELYNVNFIITGYHGYNPPGGAKTEIIYNDPQNDILITRLPDAWPRTYWVPSAAVTADPQKALAMLDTTDFKKSVILTTGENIKTIEAGDREMKPVFIKKYEPDHVVLESDTDSSGWLALSDRYFPGWNAFIDGKPVKIYKANIFVRAIPLESGKHTIDFVYRPVPLRIGAVVSLVSLIAFLLIMYKKK
jgi:hypothetical protein